MKDEWNKICCCLSMRLLLFFCLLQFGVFSQDTIVPPKISDSASHEHSRFQQIIYPNGWPQAIQTDIEYAGGYEALIEYLQENSVYPSEAIELKLEGRVYVEFIVEVDSTLSGISVIRGVHPSLDDEALKLVSEMTEWIPATVNGEPVRMKARLPVTFTLPKEE